MLAVTMKAPYFSGSFNPSAPRCASDPNFAPATNYSIHHAKAVEQWLAAHPRFTLLWLPTYCPRANPIERAFGDVHDLCTCNHMRKRLRDLVADVKAHLHLNGPWQYQLSELYYEPAVTAAVEKIASEEHTKIAA
jgi:hypothetical protein